MAPLPCGFCLGSKQNTRDENKGEEWGWKSCSHGSLPCRVVLTNCVLQQSLQLQSGGPPRTTLSDSGLWTIEQPGYLMTPCDYPDFQPSFVNCPPYIFFWIYPNFECAICFLLGIIKIENQQENERQKFKRMRNIVMSANQD